MFNKALSSIFGPSTPLRNEPTIDYNNTIQSFRSSNDESTIDSRLNNKEFKYDRQIDNSIYEYDSIGKIRRKGMDNKYTGDHRVNKEQTYNNLFNNIIEADSDDELNNDFNMILDNITKTNEKLSNTDHSLVSNFPGKFKTYDSGNSNKDKLFSESKVGSRTFGSNIYSSVINRKMEELQNELNIEQNTEMNTKLNKFSGSSPKKYQLENLVLKVEQQNRFLTELVTLVDLNAERDVPADLLKKYNQLKSEYIKELKNLESFYKAYYKLVFKYRNLKAKRRTTSVNLKEKIQLIKSSTSQSSVKLICDNLLNELNENDNLLSYYKDELEKANLRIKELENQLERKK